MCAISVSKPLLQPLKLEIQHRADIVTQDNTIIISVLLQPLLMNLYSLPISLGEGGQNNKPISCLPDTSEETDSVVVVSSSNI